MNRKQVFQPFDKAEDLFEKPTVVEKKKLIMSKKSPFYERDDLQENLSPRIINTSTSREKNVNLHARAIYRARQRVSRIESRKRQGHSRLRPTVWGGQQHIINLNAFNLL